MRTRTLAGLVAVAAVLLLGPATFCPEYTE
jgi:hypothetical protein